MCREPDGAVTYQWQFQGTDVPGATDATLVVDNVQPVQEGDYAVVVANAVGSITSDIAHLTVGLNPSCSVTPPTNTVCAGSAAHFAVNVADAIPPLIRLERAGRLQFDQPRPSRSRARKPPTPAFTR